MNLLLIGSMDKKQPNQKTGFEGLNGLLGPDFMSS